KKLGEALNRRSAEPHPNGAKRIAGLLIMSAAGFLAVAGINAAAADRLPPAGISISDADRQELTAGAASLDKEIEGLRKDLKPSLLPLLPDVEIFHKAVDWASRYDEFFDSKQPAF